MSYIIPNAEQSYSVDLALAGCNFITHGKAGTGKTTSLRFIVEALIARYPEQNCTYRIQGEGRYEQGHPIAVVAYTRQATKQAAKALSGLLDVEVTTIHNLLEYRPFKIWDNERNDFKHVMQPSRTVDNPLQQQVIIIDEMSMLGTHLFNELRAAMLEDTQIIGMGDINQLKPVHGHSVLYYALGQWPSVYLHQVYRQAAENPIIRQSLGLLEGNPPSLDLIENGSQHKHGVALVLPKTSITGDTPSHWQEKFFRQCLETDKFDPLQDKILSPFNVKLWGTVHLNKIIATILDKKQPTKPIYHIVAGVFSHYYAIGDVVMYNKEQWVIEDINPNPDYKQSIIQLHDPSPNTSRWGLHSDELKAANLDLLDIGDINLDMTMEEAAKDDSLPKQCSHHITLRSIEASHLMSTVTSLGDYSDLSLDYARTVHKSQGSQWRNVYIVLHKSQGVLHNRELLYTAMTRAQELAVLISDRKSLNRATWRTILEGDTIEERVASLAAAYPKVAYALPENTRTPPPMVTENRPSEPATPELPEREHTPAPAHNSTTPVPKLRPTTLPRFDFTQ